MLGARFCLQDDICGRSDGETRLGGTLRGVLDFRIHKYVAIGASLGLAVHNIDAGEGARARATSCNLLAQLTVYPWAKGIWHPFVGVGFGFNQDRARVTLTDEDDYKFQDWTNRGVARLSAGLDIFVKDRLSIGPRIDYDLQFAGRVCSEATDVRKDCVSFSDIDADNDDFPRWITFGLDLKGRFGNKK